MTLYEYKTDMNKIIENHPNYARLIRDVFKLVNIEDLINSNFYMIDGDLGESDYIEKFYCKHKKDIVELLGEIALANEYSNLIQFLINQNIIPDAFTRAQSEIMLRQTLYNKYVHLKCEYAAINIIRKIVLPTISKWYNEVLETKCGDPK